MIEAMHAQPGERWTLAALSERAGVSRSTFALRFEMISGSSPIDDLTRWRMLLACVRLARGSEPETAIAAAFGAAFECRMECSSRRYAGQGQEDRSR